MNRYLESSVKVLALGAIFGTMPASAESVVVDQVVADCVTGLKGVTVGADIVYSYADAKYEQTGGNFVGRDNKYDSLKHKRCCIDPSINIGYTHIHNGWYMGVSGEASFGANSERNSDFGIRSKLDTEIERASYGLKLKGGYFIKDLKSAVYGIIGIKYRDVKFSLNINDAKGSGAKLKRPLYVIGLGTEYPICKKISVSAEYEYVWRNSEDTSTLKVANRTVSLRAKQRLNEHNIRIGVKCHI
ncbi:MAG: porin family protein [Alphaproteobacteria bacterium]|nr:porin family protein [Alphaproteobacteria bacterium]